MSLRRWASSLGPLVQALRPAAGCPSRLYTPRAARTPTRVAVAFRAAHLHCGPIPRTKFRRACDAPIISKAFFSRHFRTPKYLRGGWPLAGRCSSAACSCSAGQAGGGQQEGGRRGGAGPLLPNWMCSVSVALRATRAYAFEWRRPTRSHRGAPCRTPHHASAHAHARAYGRGDGGCVYVRIAVVADSLTPLRARQCGRAGSVL